MGERAITGDDEEENEDEDEDEEDEDEEDEDEEDEDGAVREVARAATISSSVSKSSETRRLVGRYSSKPCVT